MGERSALRAQLVSDQWLAKVGQSIQIEQKLLIGPKASGDIAGGRTLQAEATEALIGAIYESIRALDPIHEWLTPYWQETSHIVLADPHRQNSKSALQEWSQGKGLHLPIYDSKELCQRHGDPKRFFCTVKIDGAPVGEGWGGSRKEAEKEAAKVALIKLENPKLDSPNLINKTLKEI